MYIYGYMYIYILYAHVYICIHIYVHTYVHTYLPSYLPTYLPTYIRTYIHTYIHTYRFMYIYDYIYICIYTHLVVYYKCWICKRRAVTCFKLPLETILQNDDFLNWIHRPLLRMSAAALTERADLLRILKELFWDMKLKVSAKRPSILKLKHFQMYIYYRLLRFAKLCWVIYTYI